MTARAIASPSVHRYLEFAMELPSLEFAQVQEIPVREKISRDEFTERYFEPDRPVIIRGAAHDWTFERVREIYGERTISIDGVAQEFSAQNTVAELVGGILGQKPHQKFYSQHCLDDDWGNDLIRGLIGDAWFPTPQTKYLWLGSHDAGGIGLHQDDGYRNLLIQAVGRKHCVLIPPSEAHLLAMTSLCSDAYPEFPFGYDSFRSQATRWPGRRSASDIDWEQFPQLRRATAFVGVLKPGECLFIPTSWFHLISILEANLSISVRWENSDWLRNRRTFHALLDLALSFMKSLPQQQRDSFASRMRAEIDARQFEDRQLLDGPVPPQHLFGWRPVRNELLAALPQLIERFHQDGLADRLPLKFFEMLAEQGRPEGQSAMAETPIRALLSPEIARFICESHEGHRVASSADEDPVVDGAKEILTRFATAATAELQKFRCRRSVSLEELHSAVKLLGAPIGPDSVKALHELLLEVAAFN